MTIRLLYLCLLFTFNYPVSSHSLYVYEDENGNKVFSDVPPIQGSFSEKEQAEVKTLKWQETPKIKSIKAPNARRNKARTQSKQKLKESRCTKLKSKISQNQKRLRTKQSPAQFDKIKQELIQLRWVYRKNC